MITRKPVQAQIEPGITPPTKPDGGPQQKRALAAKVSDPEISTEGSWSRQMRRAIRQPKAVAEQADLAAHELFPTRVPSAFAELIVPGQADDPLLLQVLPDAQETLAQPGFTADPVGDMASMAAPGVLHKYRGRVLLIATGACAINCRYCFRRHFPYSMATAATDGWRAALTYIAADPTITEVILSGGDPLTLTTSKLRRLTDQLATIAHVKRLRIHSRMPSALPDRVDSELIDWLDSITQQTVLVNHINHAQELGPAARDTLARLSAAGVTLLNQTVLLRGVNNDATTLVELSESLFANGVLPYYLHLLDPVAGAAHFDVEVAEAQAIHDEMRHRLSGFLVPRLVREVAGAASKLPLSYLKKLESGC